MSERDVAIVLSGGGMNGVLLELGFLKRLRVSSLWPRVGRIYGTSAGALTGTMAALDLLDELEEFVLGLQPGDLFRPQSLWRLPLNGLHEYALPATVGERMLDPLELGQRLCRGAGRGRDLRHRRLGRGRRGGHALVRARVLVARDAA